MVGRRLPLALVLILLAGAAPSAAGAADSPVLDVVGADAVSAKPAPAAGKPTSVVIVVANPTNARGAPTLRFATSGADDVPVTAAADPPVEIAARGVTRLRVTLTPDPEEGGDGPVRFAGTLSVALPGGDAGPAVLQVDAAGPSAPAPTFEQDSAKTTVTRLFGPISSLFGRTGPLHGRATVPLRNAAPLSSAPPVTTLLVADNGEAAAVRLRRPAQGVGDGLWTMELEVTDVDRSGDYAGVLRLNPSADEGPELEVTVAVQDFIVWPLLAIIAGALLGGVGRRYIEIRRTRARVLAVLSEAIAAYDAAEKDAPASLSRLYGDVGIPYGRTRLPAGGGAQAPAVEDIIRRVRHAVTASGRQEAVDDAAALTARLKRWVDLRNAVVALETVKAGALLTPDLADTLATHDAEALLRDEPPAIDDVDDVAARITLLDEQKEILLLIAEVWKVRAKVSGTAPPDTVARFDPREIYRRGPGLGNRRREDVALLLHRLEDARRRLLWLAGELPQDEDHAAAAVAGAGDERREAGARRAAEPVIVPSPEELEADVQSWDLAMFAVSVVVIGLAYLIPLYIGKAYGSWDQYLTAFAAGFAGTVVIPWERLPVFADPLREPEGDAAKVA